MVIIRNYRMFIVFLRSWYKEAGISFLLDFRSSRAAVVSHVVGLIQMFQVRAKSHFDVIVLIITLYKIVVRVFVIED